jgi:hypothetical protein
MPILRRLLATSVLAVALSASASVAQSPALPGTPADRIGQILIYFIDGRSYDQALAQSGDTENPFGIEADTLLYSAALYFLDTSADLGRNTHEGELSLIPRLVIPEPAIPASADFPAIMPFAFKQDGVCQAGWVGGAHADIAYSIDLGTSPCNAASVHFAVAENYRARSPVVDPGMPITRVSPSGKCIDQGGCSN